MAKIAEEIVPITVVWNDHFFDDADFDPNTIKKQRPLVITTKGFMAGENKQMLIVCQNQLEDGKLSECTYIMKRCIVRRSDKE